MQQQVTQPIRKEKNRNDRFLARYKQLVKPGVGGRAPKGSEVRPHGSGPGGTTYQLCGWRSALRLSVLLFTHL